MITLKTKVLTVEFFTENLDLFFDAYFDTFCKIKDIERLILIDDRLWKKFISDPKNLQLDFEFIQKLFNSELTNWREEFKQYFA
jgi:uncharacterized HAD superfamily protein